MKWDYRPWKVQKYDDFSFISIKGWNPLSKKVGALIMYDDKLNVKWRLDGNFTDFEVVDGRIYAIECKQGDYYFEEIDHKGKLVKSAKVIDRSEHEIVRKYCGEKSDFYVGEYPVLLPNLEHLDDEFYLIWYGKPESDSVIRTKVMFSKVDFNGRTWSKEVEIGYYGLGGLRIARSGDRIALLKRSPDCLTIINGELMYLDKDGNSVGKVNISKLVLERVGLEDIRGADYGCFLGSLQAFKDSRTARDLVLVFGEIVISATDIRAHFVALFDGTDLKDLYTFTVDLSNYISIMSMER